MQTQAGAGTEDNVNGFEPQVDEKKPIHVTILGIESDGVATQSTGSAHKKTLSSSA